MSGRSSSRRGGLPSGRSQSGRGRARGRAPRTDATQTQRQTSTKFTGNCSELKGHILDCSDSWQADLFVHTMKLISEYVGAQYKYGGDIRSSIIRLKKIDILLLPSPTYKDSKALTTEEEVMKLVYKG